jgi:osmotically-inducible protein OsmY
MKPAADSPRCPPATDAELASAVQSYLNASRADYRQISVGAEGETVTLSGSVRTFFLRQTAVAIARQVAGVRRVVDDLVVDRETLRAFGENEL